MIKNVNGLPFYFTFTAMKIIRDLADLPRFRNAVVTTGSFDGVHSGHQKILSRIKQLATKYDGESVVITFDPHPREVIYPRDESLRLLTSTEEKLHYLEKYGVDNAVILPFTVEFSQLSAREYVETFLIEHFAPRCLVVGYNHQFGLNREGDFTLLQQYADDRQFDLVRIDKFEIRNIAISSSRIREAIVNGKVEIANQALNHRYRICGEVIHGEKVGNTIGYPTANLALSSNKKLLPPTGVYAAYTYIEGVRHQSMLYIGHRPTVNTVDELSIEVHILDFDHEIYESDIDVDLVSYIRPDQKLEDLEKLREAIDQDKRDVLTALEQEQIISTAAVGLVALNYNGEEVLKKYMPSWIQNNSEQTSIYVADNGSEDGSVDFILSHYPEIGLLQFDENHGFAGGYNRALQNIDHKYFALINTDVEVSPNWLDPIIRFMEQNEEVAVCQPKILSATLRDHFEYAGGCGGFMDVIGYPFCAGRILNTVERDEGQYDNIMDIFWSSGASFVIRAEVFHAAGGFDEDYFAHQEEIDLCWTLKRAGHRIVCIPESVVYHEGGATLPYDNPRKVYLNFRNNMATLVKHLPLVRLCFTLPIRILLDILACINFLSHGKTGNAIAVVKAYFHFLGWLPSLIRKRKKLKKLVNRIAVGPSNYLGWFKLSIIAHYYLMAQRTFTSITTTGNVSQKKV